MNYLFTYYAPASHVFDESDDECDENNAESIRVICELKEKIEPKRRNRAKRMRSPDERPDKTASIAYTNPLAVPSTSAGPGRVTRSASRFQRTDPLLDEPEEDSSTANDPLEVLIDDGEDQCEYIISEFDELDEFAMDSDIKIMVENGDEMLCVTADESIELQQIAEEMPDDAVDEIPEEINEDIPEIAPEMITDEMHEDKSDEEEKYDVVTDGDDDLGMLPLYAINVLVYLFSFYISIIFFHFLQNL